MAITMRKGAYADFDPSKMKAGEWAVSADTDSNKQQVWMCFSPGVVKRMGTVEDFDMEIQILIKNYLDGMAESVEKAQESAKLATSKAQESATSASQAKTSATNAKTSETNSAKSESEAQKYAEQAKEISESLSGALRPLGTISFANLPSTADASSGDMYNITDQFTTTADFKEGSGNAIPAGSNVYLTIDRYWDVLAGTPVTGVKGNAEKLYRRGNVNITPANIGLGNLTNDRQIKGLASGATNGHIVSFGANGYTVADSGLAVSQIATLAKPYATCATGRATNAKVATLAGFVLNIGVTIAVKFTDTAGTENPASGNLTLNVNNTGAKTIAYTRNGSKSALVYSTGAYFYNNATHIFTYDGTYWICMDFNTDNNTINSAGASNKTSTKLFLVGTTAQTNGITSYSNANCYIGTDNKLYSGGKVVANNEDLTALSDKVGTADISAIGDGTITGAISDVNQSLIQTPVTLVANSTRITLEDATCYYSSMEKRIYIVAKFTAKVSATAPILAVNNYNDRRSATPLIGVCITSGYYGCIPCWTRNNGSNISISAALTDGKTYTISGFIEVNVVM